MWEEEQKEKEEGQKEEVEEDDGDEEEEEEDKVHKGLRSLQEFLENTSAEGHWEDISTHITSSKAIPCLYHLA